LNQIIILKKLISQKSGDLMKEEEVLEWLIHQKSADEIEDVSDVVLEQMIDSSSFLAVLFCMQS
jgi:type II secretory pathway component PulL